MSAAIERDRGSSEVIEMAEEERSPQIVYVPGGPTVNRYEIEEDVVVLDKALQDYPVAHDLVREHELEHARQNHEDAGLLEHLTHEFRTDVQLYVSTSDEANALRAYLKGESRRGVREASGELLQILRQTWNMVLAPCGFCYRSVRGMAARIRGAR